MYNLSLLSPGESGKRLKPILRVLLKKIFRASRTNVTKVKCLGQISSPNPQENIKRVPEQVQVAVGCVNRLVKYVLKNLFPNGNRALLSAAEEIYDQPLRNEDELPHLLVQAM